MRYLDLHRGKMPALGFGTWQMTGDECEEAVLDALEIGYRHIDTAQAYDNEERVGRAIERSGVDRGEIFLTTKVWWERLSVARAIESTHASLERLGTDYVDLLLVHWPPPGGLSLDEPLMALTSLQTGGAARSIGVSNFTPPMIDAAVEKASIVCDQVEYHPFLGQRELLDSCRRHGLVLTAYSPLARGSVLEEPTLREIGEAHGKSPAQVALRWLLQQEGVAAIPKAASAEHRRANFDVFDFELTGEEMDRVFALDRGQRLVDPPFAPDWGDTTSRVGPA